MKSPNTLQDNNHTKPLRTFERTSSDSSWLIRLQDFIINLSRRTETNTSRILSPVFSPACSAFPPGRIAVTWCRGPYSSPLMAFMGPPSSDGPLTLNPNPMSLLEMVKTRIPLSFWDKHSSSLSFPLKFNCSCSDDIMVLQTAHCN